MSPSPPVRVPVLMYHGLHATPASRGRFDGVYSVRPDDFAQQLDWLLARGYRTCADGLCADAGACDALTAATRPLAITFDDGDVSNIEVALPLLRERAMVATFFVTSDFVDQPGMLSRADLRALAAAGMRIGAHGRTHAFLEDLDAAALIAELADSRTLLRAITGTAIDAIALPGGRGGERERLAAMTAGFQHLYGSVPGPNRRPRPGQWQQRLAITREMPPAAFAALVEWSGLPPRLARLRFSALRLPKRVLGNDRYARLRGRLL